MILRKQNIARRLVNRYVLSVQGQSGEVILSPDDINAETKKKDNLLANTNPGKTDDSSKGYMAMSKWVNLQTGEMFTCIDATPGAAVWKTSSLTLSDLGTAATVNIGTSSADVPTVGIVKSLIPTYDPVTKNSLSLNHVDNTPDAQKPVSVPQQMAIQDAIDLIMGKMANISYNDLKDLPILFSGYFKDLKDIPTFFDGNYDSLTNKPKLFDFKYDSLTGKPQLFDWDYNSLNNKPVLFDGKFESLTGKPMIFTGFYADLKDKPVLFDWDYNSLKNLPTLFDWDYTSLRNKPTLFDGKWESITGKPVFFDGRYASLTGKPTLVTDYSQLTGLPTLFDWEYSSLKNKPLIPTKLSQLQNDTGLAISTAIPTRVGQLTNDSGYITISSIPTAISAFTNDKGYITSSAIPSNISYFLNDAGYAKTSALPKSTSDISEGSNLYFTIARVVEILNARNIKASKYFDVTTDANSQWKIDVSAIFSSIDFVTAQGLSTMTNTNPLIGEQRIATVHDFGATDATVRGSAVKNNMIASILITGSPGMLLSGAGTKVKVKIEGTLK